MSTDVFWSAAASLSGRVDFRPLRPALQRGPLPPPSDLLVAAGLSVAQAQQLRQPGPSLGGADRVTLIEAAWPEGLADVPYAPALLFLRGNRALLAGPAIAIVGSRRCTATGKRMARRLARACVEAGGVVVSGLAHGIDHQAHEASLARTIAVLGQGLDAPLTHRQFDLAGRIVDAGGLLVSEFPPTAPAARWTFPQRNRVIAGLAQATIVVEAAQRSGALITARQALALGREVLAVPGSPMAPASVGCLDLINDGAGLARSEQDIQRLLPRQLSLTPARGSPAQNNHALPAPMLLALEGGADLDQLMALTGWPAARTSALLTALELAGQVERLPGDRFCRRRPD